MKEIFTRAKIWALLGDKDHTSASLEWCLDLIAQYGGNIHEARSRATSEGRNIDNEMVRWNELRGI